MGEAQPGRLLTAKDRLGEIRSQERERQGSPDMPSLLFDPRCQGLHRGHLASHQHVLPVVRPGEGLDQSRVGRGRSRGHTRCLKHSGAATAKPGSDRKPEGDPLPCIDEFLPRREMALMVPDEFTVAKVLDCPPAVKRGTAVKIKRQGVRPDVDPLHEQSNVAPGVFRGTRRWLNTKSRQRAGHKTFQRPRRDPRNGRIRRAANLSKSTCIVGVSPPARLGAVGGQHRGASVVEDQPGERRILRHTWFAERSPA